MMTISEDMERAYLILKTKVDGDGMPHSAIAGLKKMTLEPAFAPDGEERRYRMRLGPITRD